MEGNYNQEGNNNQEGSYINEENENQEEDIDVVYEDDQYNNSEEDGGNEDFSFGGSEPTPLGGIYELFKNTLERKDSTKVSNLNAEELGHQNLSVRDCNRIALIASTFKHPGVSTFFLNQSRIITDTAMSKKGWFTELFVTSKKYASRDSSSSVLNLPPQSQTKKDKWKIFSGKNQEVPQQLEE